MHVPLPFTQSYDVGTPASAWVTNSPGERMMENMNILEAADKYDVLRRALGIKSLPPPAYYLAHCRELHNRIVPGPTITMGWSEFASSGADVVSTKVLMRGASGSRIYNMGSKRSSRSVIEILKEYHGWPNLNGMTTQGAGPQKGQHSFQAGSGAM